MADKQSKLEIVISAVDKATAGIRAIKSKIDAIAVLAAPIGLIGERLGGLAKEAGLPKLVDGFKGVGGAVKEVLGNLAVVGGIAGVAVAGMFHLVDGFDALGDKAEALGVGVDFLAQMRYAAERAGAPMEALDVGLKTLGTGLGEATINKGPLVEFLKNVSPALLKQLKAAKGTEQAFDLLADAMAKVQDPAKRLILAQKTLGNAELAPLLAKGSKGLKELRGEYFATAGSQEAAASAAGKVDDSMKQLKAATDGIKAALVEGLGPALGQLVEELKAFLGENRGRIAEWAKDLGKRLPGAIHSLVDSFLGALDTAQGFIESIGGIKTVALGLAAFIVGPLISAVVSLGAALLTTPVGWIVTGIAAIVYGAYQLYKHWDGIAEFFSGLWGSVAGAFQSAIDGISSAWDAVTGAFRGAWQATVDFIVGVFRKSIGWVVDKIEWVANKIKAAKDWVTGDDNPAAKELLAAQGNQTNPFGGTREERDARVQRALAAVQARDQQAKITVDFANAPRGTRVQTDPQSTATVDLAVGYQMGFGP